MSCWWVRNRVPSFLHPDALLRLPLLMKGPCWLKLDSKVKSIIFLVKPKSNICLFFCYKLKRNRHLVQQERNKEHKEIQGTQAGEYVTSNMQTGTNRNKCSLSSKNSIWFVKSCLVLLTGARLCCLHSNISVAMLMKVVNRWRKSQFNLDPAACLHLLTDKQIKNLQHTKGQFYTR